MPQSDDGISIREQLQRGKLTPENRKLSSLAVVSYKQRQIGQDVVCVYEVAVQWLTSSRPIGPISIRYRGLHM